MSYYQNKLLHIICEGKSERNYLDALNRLLREQGIGLTLRAFNPQKNVEVGGGHYTLVVAQYKKFRKFNRNVQPWIWVDEDLYCRNTKNCANLYEQRPKGIPPFLFNIHNFEDFLALHTPKDRVLEWLAVCRDHGHLSKPLPSDQYMDLFRDFFSEYRKGELPNMLSQLSAQQVENALVHSRDASIPLKCEFIEKLATYITQEFPSCGSPWNR